MRSRILIGTLFGAIGGLLGFLIQEPLVPHDLAMLAMSQTRQGTILVITGLIVGAAIGTGVGAIEGAAQGSARRLLVGAAVGALVGAVGGAVGIYIGAQVFGMALFGKDSTTLQFSRSTLDFVHLVIARALGWTFLGALPGLAAGASTRSPRRAMHGLFGGLIGGFIGGVVFDTAGNLVTPLLGAAAAASGATHVGTGGPGRAIGFGAIGLFTGLFVGLVSELLKQAWLRVLVGKNEGKDFFLAGTLTILGRDERADVPLFADPQLSAQHAAVRAEDGRYVLHDGGTPLGSRVNGQRITAPQPLLDGDVIQLGRVNIQFREKASAGRVVRHAGPESPRSAPSTLAAPPGACPFCGAPKTGAGGCLCSVGPAAPPGPAFATAPTAMLGSAGGPAFVGVDGPYAGRRFPVSDGTTVGRELDQTIALGDDTSVSRRHARIQLEAGSYIVIDEGSANGTTVNGVRITRQTLAPGDVVSFGASRFRFE